MLKERQNEQRASTTFFLGTAPSLQLTLCDISTLRRLPGARMRRKEKRGISAYDGRGEEEDDDDEEEREEYKLWRKEHDIPFESNDSVIESWRSEA